MNDNQHNSKLEALESEIDTQIESFQKKRKTNRKTYYWLAVLQSIFSISVTIILGLIFSEDHAVAVKNSALIASGIANILGSIYAIFKPREKLLLYTKIVSELKSVKSKVKLLKIVEANTNDAIVDVFNEFQSILNSSNQTWQTLMKKEETKHESKQNDNKQNIK